MTVGRMRGLEIAGYLWLLTGRSPTLSFGQLSTKAMTVKIIFSLFIHELSVHVSNMYKNSTSRIFPLFSENDHCSLQFLGQGKNNLFDCFPPRGMEGGSTSKL